MIDQKAIIDLAIKAGVIDDGDIRETDYIGQAYIEDLAHFADLAMQVERAEIMKMLELFHANLVEIKNEYGPDVVRAAINMLEDLEQ